MFLEQETTMKKYKQFFYDDKENDIMLGYVNYNEAIDYLVI